MKDDLIGQQFLIVPVGALPGQPQIFIGAAVPAAVSALVVSQFGGTFQSIACTLYERDTSDYWFDVLVNDTNVPGNVLIARGYIGAVSNISQYWLFNLTSNATSLVLGAGPFDGSVQLGAIANGSQINVLGNPQNRIDLNASTAVRALISSVENLRVDSTGVHIPAFIPWTIDGNSAPRGTIGYDVATVPLSGINIETVCQIGSTLTFKNGRAYKVTIERNTSSTTANGQAIYILRRNSLTGAALYQWEFPMAANAGVTQFCRGECYLMNNSGADITDHLDLTLQLINGGAGTLAESGSVTTPFQRRTMHYEDIGDVTMFANAHQI